MAARSNAIGPRMLEQGLRFVGVDVIGDYITEINVTSPTCVRELDKIFSLNILIYKHLSD